MPPAPSTGRLRRRSSSSSSAIRAADPPRGGRPTTRYRLGITEIVEKKGQSNFAFGFIAVVMAVAALRGLSKAPVVAAILGVVAVAAAAVGIYSALQPARVLRISRDEITWGPAGKVVDRIGRQPSTMLRFRRNAKIGSPWLLYSIDGTGSQIPLDGFHPVAVGQACTEHGWEFENRQPFNW